MLVANGSGHVLTRQAKIVKKIIETTERKNGQLISVVVPCSS